MNNNSHTQYHVDADDCNTLLKIAHAAEDGGQYQQAADYYEQLAVSVEDGNIHDFAHSKSVILAHIAKINADTELHHNPMYTTI